MIAGSDGGAAGPEHGGAPAAQGARVSHGDGAGERGVGGREQQRLTLPRPVRGRHKGRVRRDVSLSLSLALALALARSLSACPAALSQRLAASLPSLPLPSLPHCLSASASASASLSLSLRLSQEA